VRGRALKVLLLTGQRPGEVVNMRREHLKDGWWEMPGEEVPELGWPGTKNKQAHRVWLPTVVRELIAGDKAGAGATGFVFAGPHGKPRDLDDLMREICAKLQIEPPVWPHDLRRTHGSTITALGFGRDAMNRIQNHKEGGIASIYDRHGYSDENRRIMERVADHLIGLAEGRDGAGAKVLRLRA
jgi:integrase